MKKLFSAVTGFLAILAVLCSYDDRMPAGRSFQSDSTYVTSTVYMHLGEIDAGNVAMQRSAANAIRSYGEMLIKEHLAAHAELMGIAQNAGYPLPKETDQEHKDITALLATLSGREFDSVFIYRMLEEQETAIILQQKEIDEGSDAVIRDYASKILPVLQLHRDQADSLARALFPAGTMPR